MVSYDTSTKIWLLKDGHYQQSFLACYCLIDNHNSSHLGMYGPALCTSSFGTLPYLNPEGVQPKTVGTAEIYPLPFFFTYIKCIT